MKTFIYKGVRLDGTVVQGMHEAEVLQEVYRRMEYRGLYPVSAREVDDSTAILMPASAPAPRTQPVVSLAA